MASYNELIALIDAYINRNGVQAITGQVLNGVLKAMVEQVGRGYAIMGVAQPGDDPGTPDAPESYFASTPGTYTNFGGLVVADAEFALLSYNPTTLAWSKDTLTEGIEEVQASIDANVGTPAVSTSYENGVLTFTFSNMKGNTGDAAGFGNVTAQVDSNIGTPGVTVETSGPDTAKNIAFKFVNLKGETGVTSVLATVDNTSGNPQCAVSLNGQQLTLAFTGLKGAQGDTGSSVDYPFTIVNNLTTNDATQALSAAMGVQLESEISQLEAKVEQIETSEAQDENEEITISDSNNNQIVKIDGNGVSVTGNLKKNNQNVVVEDDLADIETDIEELQDVTSDISRGSGQSEDEEIQIKTDGGVQVTSIKVGVSVGEDEQVWSNDSGSEEYVKIGSYGIKTKGLLDIGGEPIIGLPGKSVLWLGDSIMNGVGSVVGKSCVDFATAKLGCSSYNGGVGGRRYRSGTGVTTDASFIDVAEAMVSGDWTKVENGISGIAERNPNNPVFATVEPSYQVIETLDFSKLDYLFINYGTNDWGGSVDLTNPNDTEDTTTALGALRKGIRFLLTAYPQLRIYAAAPLFRNDGTTPNQDGVTLRQYADAIIQCYKDFGIPCLDTYAELGVNQYNYTEWLADGVHPNVKGAELLGNKYANFLSNN